jgi:hypothetical protein
MNENEVCGLELEVGMEVDVGNETIGLTMRRRKRMVLKWIPVHACLCLLFVI